MSISSVRKRAVSLLALAMPLALSVDARAHLELLSPKARYPSQFQKDGPCAKGAMDARTTNVSRFRPGETITVSWDEYVDHDNRAADPGSKGFYRISFDPDGTDDFTIPPPDETNLPNKFPKPTFPSGPAPYELPVDIEDKADQQMYSVEVKLPNVTCSNCTLQVIQVMVDKPPYRPAVSGAALYFQCADLVLDGDPVPDGGVAPDGSLPVRDAGTSQPDGATIGTIEPGCGCRVGRGGGTDDTTALALLGIAGLLLACRRRFF